ncbi:MAG TPA: c-type cytochrome [Chryseolinea sp.]|nr:c-type cytochrome [Chryseolinea sp.]
MNCLFLVFLVYVIVSVVLLLNPPSAKESQQPETNNATIPLPAAAAAKSWQAPDSTRIPQTAEGDRIRYGRELVAHTAVYLGPEGKVRSISNGMNCQNCHLHAGKKFFGNNYSGVASMYPKFRARSGTVETVQKRVNDCIERSLNGMRLEDDSEEMKAFVAYILWVGSEVPRGEYPKGAGIIDLPFLGRPASPPLGRIVYDAQCVRCHGANGEGKRERGTVEWTYPPLFGKNSFNIGAGLFRLSRLAGYVKANMPYGVEHDKALLTDEQAWDVAAYITSLPRPVRKFPKDWPDIATKPFDHPFGPYADAFTENEHKYGPFGPMKTKKTK